LHNFVHSTAVAQHLRPLRRCGGHKPEVAAAEHQPNAHPDIAAHQALFIDAADPGEFTVRPASLATVPYASTIRSSASWPGMPSSIDRSLVPISNESIPGTRCIGYRRRVSKMTTKRVGGVYEEGLMRRYIGMGIRLVLGATSGL
jgi:hypothetical protein